MTATPIRGDTPRVSVVIPARNAAATIHATLDSLISQTLTDWEAVVLDDGSTDETAAIVAEYTARDARLRLITGPQSGAAAARNRGIAATSARFLHFLDGDDWIAPPLLERLVAELGSDPSLDAVTCGWAMVTYDGETIEEGHCYATGDLFPILARRSAFPIHACVIRRHRVEEAGGFDPGFTVTHDWLMWQRIARMGARFGRVHEVMAFYRTRPASLTSDIERLLRHALRVIACGHGPDPAVRAPGRRHAHGAPVSHRPAAELEYACWCAGASLAVGTDPAPLLEELSGTAGSRVGTELADSLFRAVPIALGRTHDAWREAWPAVEPRLDGLLDELEHRAGTRGLSRGVRARLERQVLTHVAMPLPMTTGLTHAIAVEVTRPLPEPGRPAGVERLSCRVDLEGAPLGWVHCAWAGDTVSVWLLRDIIADAFAWPILGRFFARTVYDPAADARAAAERHDAIGWATFLRELWGQPSRRSARVGARAAIEAARPPAAIITREPTVELSLLLAGLRACHVRLPVPDGRMEFATMRRAFEDALDMEACRIAVREALIGAPFDQGGSLGDRLKRAVRRWPDYLSDPSVEPPTAALVPGWRGAVAPFGRNDLLLARRGRQPAGTAGLRRAELPAEALPALHDAAHACGEVLVRIGGPPVRRVFYVPGLQVGKARLFERTDDPVGSGPVTGIGRVDLPAPAMATMIRWTSSAPRTAAPVEGRLSLPILMYRRVAPEPRRHRASGCVTPDTFEHQLRYLAEAGFVTVTLERWRVAVSTGRPLDARAIMLSFDGGFQDFADHAWPLLRSFGFSALVNVVTGRVGTRNDWDPEAAGDELLMDWPTLRRLRAEGVEVGSHTDSHARLTGASPAEIVRQCAASRAALARELGVVPVSIAYPFGDHDEVVHRMAGACGYAYGLCSGGGPARREDPLLALPRIEVSGTGTIEAFIAWLGA